MKPWCFLILPALVAPWAAAAETGRLDDRRMFPSGEVAFEKLCGRCHTGRPEAVGPDLHANRYDPDTIRTFARNGSGPMPAFTAAMIDDRSLDQIAAWLAASAPKGESR